MKSLNYLGVTYVNPSLESLLEVGVAEQVATDVMAMVVAQDAQQERDARLAVAALRIAPLQDAVDLAAATEAEAALLLAWKGYRVELNRITEQEGYPGAVVWPEPPALS